MRITDAPAKSEREAGIASSTSNGARVWKVGTLTYTFGGLVALFAWLLWGDFAWAVRERAIQAVAQLLFKKYGASDFLTGLLIGSIPAGLGLLIGPVVGYKSDRLRTRWGRRIPFLLITTPFMVLALVGLAFCPQLGEVLHRYLGNRSPGLASSILIFLGLSWVVFEISLVTANSVYFALINDVVPQEVLGRFFGLFRVVSLIVGIAFFFWLMADAESHVTAIFLSTAVVYGFGFTLMCLRVREGEYPEVVPKKESFVSAAITYCREGFGNPYYLWFFAATILAGFATGPFNLYSVFYAKSVSMSMGMFGKCLALTYCTSLCLSYPLGCLVDRFHPLRISAFVMGIYAIVMALSFVFVRDAWTFAIALYVHGVVAGTYGTVSASIGQRLLPRAKFAEIGSAGGIIASIVGMGFAPAIGSLLDRTGHDYRDTFLLGYGLAAITVAVFFVLHRKFVALGGPDHYHAPEPGPRARTTDHLNQVSSAR
jgi:MFS family permease